MINIMYLVLMALLALNVSAEVMNAFQTLDEGNEASIGTVDKQLQKTVSGLETLLKDDAKAKFRPIQPAIAEVKSITSEFNTYIDEIQSVLIDRSGNNNGEEDEGDFKETIKIGTLAGWDSDNPTATWGGLLGFMYGHEAIQELFDQPLSNRYNIHRTRQNFPNEGIDSFENMAAIGLQIVDRVIHEEIGGTLDLERDVWMIPKKWKDLLNFH